MTIDFQSSIPKIPKSGTFGSKFKHFFCEILQRDKFEGADFKYDNSFLKFQPENNENTVSIFEYVIKQYFMQNKKFSNLEPKMLYLYNFGL